MGRLTREPEIRYAQVNNMAVARFSLAVDRKGRKDDGQQTADFINHIAFGKTAEFVEKYIHKGTKIVVVGHIQTGNYKDKDGKTVYTTDVIVDELEFAESKSSAAANGVNTNSASKKSSDDFMIIPDDVGDEGLPFGD